MLADEESIIKIRKNMSDVHNIESADSVLNYLRGLRITLHFFCKKNCVLIIKPKINNTCELWAYILQLL